MSAAAGAVNGLGDLNRYANLALTITVAVLVFGAVCKLLRVAELSELIATLRVGSRAA
jgi:hypothetical protein